MAKENGEVIGALGEKAVLPGVEIRNLVHLGCSMEAVVDGSLDAAAREIHERYVREVTTKGMTLAQNSLLVSWQDLPEAYREANRSQADNTDVKKASALVGSKPGLQRKHGGGGTPEVDGKPYSFEGVMGPGAGQQEQDTPEHHSLRPAKRCGKTKGSRYDYVVF